MNSLLKHLLIPLSYLLATASPAIPEIQHWTTDNGTRVYFVAAPELPMIDLECTFGAGSVRDQGQPGLAYLTNQLLNEGAGGLSAEQLAEKLDDVGAQLSLSSDRDSASISLRSLNDAEPLSIALNTLRLMLSQAEFAQTPFARVQQQQLTRLKWQDQQPDSKIEKAFYQTVYGQHPYASPVGGTPESIAALTPADLKRFYQRHYTANNALIAMVGALDRETAEKIAHQLASALPTGEPLPPIPKVPPLTEPQTLHLDHPSTQTHLILGHLGVPRSDPDYFALYLGNYILGGNGLVSQLAEEIREQRGLAYSVYSYFYPQKETGVFLANLQTRTDQTPLALQLMTEKLRKFVEKGPSAEELQKAKQSITGQFPARIASNGKILSYLSTIGFYELPLDYLQTYSQKIEALTLKDIQTAFQKHLNLNHLITVTLGESTPK